MTAATAAVVKDGTVENLIVVDIDADRKTTYETPEGDVVVLPDGAFVDLGWLYDGADFAAPVSPSPEAHSEEVSPTPEEGK